VLVAEGNQVAAHLTYTGTHRGPIWASRRPTGASSMPALRSSGSAMDASPMDGGSAIPPRCARSSPVRPGGKSRVRRAFRDRHLLVAATLISSRTPKREHVPVKPDGSKPTASLADAVRPADPISNRKSDKAAESDHGHAGRDPLVPSTANARLQTGTNRPGDQCQHRQERLVTRTRALGAPPVGTPAGPARHWRWPRSRAPTQATLRRP
jgi:hypothetical protein